MFLGEIEVLTARWGYATGWRSGCFVVDLDGAEGVEQFEQLTEAPRWVVDFVLSR